MKTKKPNKVILFYNPNSGNGLFKSNMDYIIKRFQRAGLQVVPVRAAGEFMLGNFLKSLDQDTYKEEYRQIIAAGGDGTINICVDNMLKHNIDLPLAVFPSGTANDFAFCFDIPNTIKEMIDIALGDNTTISDIGRANDRIFINVTAIGRVVDVSQKTDPILKNTIGVLAYYLKGMTEIPNLKAVKVKLTMEDRIVEEEIFFMVVMNGKSAGGFKRIATESEINDGLFEVILFKKTPLLDMPNVFFKILAGNHYDSKYVTHIQTNNMLLEAEEYLPTDIDGEMGEQLPIKFSVDPVKIRVFTKEMNLGK